MKALSIKEPYASCIREKKKFIETRSWKTNYRGELLIHASSTGFMGDGSFANYVVNVLGVNPFRQGVIHCKVRLVDCIKMDEEFIRKMISENRQEYNLGFYEPGRYAWVMEFIEAYDVNKQPVVKGKLGIWDYESEEN